MRKSPAATAATSSLNGSRSVASLELVCVALVLAIAVLLGRIAAVL